MLFTIIAIIKRTHIGRTNNDGDLINYFLMPHLPDTPIEKIADINVLGTYDKILG